jgi:filamentous hemagglutinin
MMISEYLGNHVSSMLGKAPFKNWPVEQSSEEDLEESITHYLFTRHGLELRCDRDDNISVIFLYADNYGGFDEGLLEIPFSSSRAQTLEHFGSPSKSGGKTSDPVLGEYGAWDRFTRQGYAIHVEYRTDSDRISKITLMRSEVVPE